MAIHFILIVGHQNKTRNYVQAVRFLGYYPIVTDTLELLNDAIPDLSSALPLLSFADALILPGGGDISPYYLHEENKGSHNIDEKLDLVQLSYLDYFIKKKKPIIGICKGMQLINIAFGGTLLQNMSPDRLLLHQAQNGFDNYHSCNYELFEGYPMLTSIFDNCTPGYINSAHHQCILKTAPGLYPFMHASDGTIEGFIHTELPILGLQWHPERKLCPDGNYLKIYLYRLLKYAE